MKHLKTYEILTEYESARKVDLSKIYFFEGFHNIVGKIEERSRIDYNPANMVPYNKIYYVIVGYILETPPDDEENGKPYFSKIGNQRWKHLREATPEEIEFYYLHNSANNYNL